MRILGRHKITTSVILCASWFPLSNLFPNDVAALKAVLVAERAKSFEIAAVADFRASRRHL